MITGDHSKKAPEVRISLDCYEGPDGKGPGALDFDEECICRHLFLCGATGSGKTTMLRAITRQLIASHTDDPDLRPGLVILDFKGDGTVEHVRAAAAAAGRSADVRVLSLDSDTSYDFFGECRSIKHAAEFAERLQFGCGGMIGGADVFWHEFRHNLLAAAVTWLSSIHGANRSFADWISHASAWLLTERLSGQHRSEIETLRERAAERTPGTSDRIALDHTLRLVEEWDGVLDARTRGNARATLHNALRPLLEEPVLHLFRSTAERKFRVASAVSKGRILVVSINAFLHPQLAALVGRCIKADFYSAVFSRKKRERLVTLIADEFQLIATAGSSRYDDAAALPLLREYRAGMIAATQTLVSLDKAIGTMNRRLLVGNFNTLGFLRSTEPELALFAEQVCGTVETTVTIRERYRDDTDSGSFSPGYERHLTKRVQRSVCPRGALARLEPGQAYFLRPSGEPCLHPVWVAANEH